MKTYFNPTTEIVEIETKWMLCSQDGTNTNNGNVTSDPDPLGGAPRRQVF